MHINIDRLNIVHIVDRPKGIVSFKEDFSILCKNIVDGTPPPFKRRI